MKVRVRIFGDIAEAVGSHHEVELEQNASILTLTNTLQKKSGLTRRGYLAEFKVGGADLAVMVNGKNIALLNGVYTTLSDNDDIVIMPFVVGG
jgi:molybdopterin converting factor small subunit